MKSHWEKVRMVNVVHGDDELWPKAEDVRGITTNPSSASGGTS